MPDFFLVNDEMNMWQGISAFSLNFVCVVFIAELGFVCLCVCMCVEEPVILEC